MGLFPSRFIAIGGDEAIKDQWRASPAIQAQIHSLGLANEDALQSWFTARVVTFLSAHGRRAIGWDDIVCRPRPQRRGFVLAYQRRGQRGPREATTP